MKPLSKFAVLPGLLLCSNLVPDALSDDACTYERVITAADPGTYDYFGYSVAIDGDVSVIGTGYDDTLGTDAGSAYVFRWNGQAWIQEQKLVASDLDQQDFMGWYVAVDGNHIAVSAPGNDQVGEWAGAVYLYEFDGTSWVQTAKLTPSAEQWNEWYGNVVVLDGDVLAVGTPFHTKLNSPFRSGAVYIYRLTGTVWAEEQIVTPPDPHDEGRFGSFVALQNGRLLVGEDYEYSALQFVKGYLFTFNSESWIEAPPLVATDEIYTDDGAIVALDGDRALVSPGSWDGSLGEVHEFEFDGAVWNKTAVLRPPAGAAANGFGMTVAASDDLILVGHPLADNVTTDAGAVHVYHQSDGVWQLEDTLLPSILTTFGKFGLSLAARDNRAITGAPYANEAGLDTGTVYIYHGISDGDCNNNNSLDACDIAGGTSLDCNADSQPDECLLIDCNQNGIQDECDILTGVSLDCQSDAVPDECQGMDCNANGLLDQCDIGGGSSLDVNDNGIPDECEVACLPECDLAAKVELAVPATNDFFGSAAAISGGTAVIGADGDDRDDGGSGSVSFFHCDGTDWTLDQTVFADDAILEFGGPLDLDGNVAVVRGGYEETAAVYVFRKLENGWEQWQKLVPSVPKEDYTFGRDVAIDGDRIVVGYPYWSVCYGCLPRDPTVIVYREDGNVWVEEQVLMQDIDPDWDGAFGSGVAIQDDYIFVVDAWDDSGGGYGSIYVFQYDGSNWNLDQKLYQPGGGCEFSSGKTIAVSGSSLITCSGYEGAAIFRQTEDQWEFEQLLESDTFLPSNFGYSVGLYSDLAIVGASGLDDAGNAAGGAYLYQFDGAGWILIQKYVPSEAVANDFFGHAVDISEQGAVIGGYGDDGSAGAYQGSAILLSRVLDDCNSNGVADECDIEGESSADCNGNGRPDECESDCNENDFPDDCDIDSGVSHDCNANGAPDECEDDCNGNLIEDSCDIADGISLDCQLNNIPDECELDCNSNAIPDVCDVADGTSRDADANGIPDECDACDDLTRIDGPDTDVDDDFGSGVSIDGDTVVIGAYSDDRYGSNVGTAFLYTWNGSEWAYAQELPPTASADTQYYGLATAIDGDVAAVLSLYDGINYDPGSLTLFRHIESGWHHEATLWPWAGEENAANSSLAVDGGVFVIGNHNLGSYAGGAACYEYDDTTWVKHELDPGDIEDYDHYGSAVSVDGEWLMVGAEWDKDLVPYGGAVAAFQKTTDSWSFVERFYPSDPEDWQYFGAAVDVRGTWAAVGAPNDGAGNEGAAYVFYFDGVSWVEQQKLTPSDGVDASYFGQSVAFGDDFIIVGSQTSEPSLDAYGVAYLFRLMGDQWVEMDRLVPSDNKSPYYFSFSLDADGSSAIIGMPFDSFPAAYIYGELTGFDCNSNLHHDYCDIWSGIALDCNANDLPDECDISSGSSADANANGIPDECEETECLGDANGDNVVDPLDSGYVLARFGCPVNTGDPLCDAADVNEDGIVDPLDAGFVLSRFGECP